MGAASGYLVRSGDTSLLVDCGPGIVGELVRSGEHIGLDAVLVTHEHFDHCGDLMTLAFRRGFPEVLRPIPLYGPVDLLRVVSGLDEVFGIPTLPELSSPLSDQLPFRPLNAGTTVSIGDVRVETRHAAHPVTTLSLKFPDLDVAYTADTGLTEELVDFCAGTGTLLAEATYVSSVGRDFDAHGHMAGAEAGELAARADVDLLVLTHLSDPAESAATIDAARQHFDGPIELARPGLVLGNGRRSMRQAV